MYGGSQGGKTALHELSARLRGGKTALHELSARGADAYPASLCLVERAALGAVVGAVVVEGNLHARLL